MYLFTVHVALQECKLLKPEMSGSQYSQYLEYFLAP